MKRWPQSFRCLFAVLILSLNLNFLFFILRASAQDFTIDRFHSDIMIQRDSSVIVKETIDVMFHRPRHGIYRELPFRYRDELGKVITTPTRILSVADASGKASKYRVEKSGPVIHVRIGDPKRYVDGNQTYVITYEVENAILFLNDHDELYWNVTGNYWKAPIREASAMVFLTTKEKSKSLWAAGYTGGYGSKGTECSYETYENSGTFSAKRNLNMGEGLTIAFGWDKALVFPPSSWKKFLWSVNLKENWFFLLPILSFLYMFTLWYQKGRDPNVRESVTVMYDPPKFENQPLTPAEVGTLIDEKLDPRDITSTIVGLAVKGYIKIEETKKEGILFDKTDYYLRKVKGPDANVSLFERELMERLVGGSPGVHVSDLKNRFYAYLPELKNTLYGELRRKKYFLRSPEEVRILYMIAGVVVFFLSIFAFVFFLPGSGWKGIIASILTGIPILGFAKFMPVKTRAGASAYMDILGFQEFLNRAEKDRLERMGDMNLFSKFLPYAIALDVADSWAKAFEGIYQDPPDWYVSPGGFRTFTPHAFAHSFNSVTSDLSSALFSAPRGSGIGGGGGFGGGGFSGGGFGGGGGGSW